MSRVSFIQFPSRVQGLPDGVRVGVVASDGGDDAPRLLPLSDGHLVMALRQDRTLVHVVNVDRDRGGGRRAVPPADQSHRVLTAEHQDVLALTLKVQHLWRQTRQPQRTECDVIQKTIWDLVSVAVLLRLNRGREAMEGQAHVVKGSPIYMMREQESNPQRNSRWDPSGAQ